MKLQIGQILYSYDLNEYKISKIGNKYFECEEIRGKFNKETLKFVSEYSSSLQLYIEKQNVLDLKEREKLHESIRNKIPSYGNINISLEDLRIINEILYKVKPDNEKRI